MLKVTFELPKGEAIQCCIRFKSFLCVETNFNAMRYIDLAENNLVKSQYIDSFEAVQVYDDDSGYWLFRLADGYDTEKLFDDVQVWFEDYFEKV